jgi:hypothetical protein
MRKESTWLEYIVSGTLILYSVRDIKLLATELATGRSVRSAGGFRCLAQENLAATNTQTTGSEVLYGFLRMYSLSSSRHSVKVNSGSGLRPESGPADSELARHPARLVDTSVN